MAYSELIKNFDRIRGYMREFYVYGFKSREEYDRKSARSYDDERRRIESWLGEFMGFRQTPEGKNVFITIDSRSLRHNPLYKAWKAKSFTDGDITIHFILFDILHDPSVRLTAGEITRIMDEEYLAGFSVPRVFDESTIRKKLKEYVGEGLLESEKTGKCVRYHRSRGVLPGCVDALHFYSETAPCGVIGSFLLDKAGPHQEHFAFKHHYITQALDSDILCRLFLIMRERRAAEIENFSRRAKHPGTLRILPLRVFISVQNGRQYLMAWLFSKKRIVTLRLDYILSVKPLEVQEDFSFRRAELDRVQKHMWGVAARSKTTLEHVEFVVRYREDEQYIYNRLQREKRCGTVEKLDDHSCRFSAEVYDINEMFPWIRTFLCRITDIHFSDQVLEEKFRRDLKAMYAMYGVGGGLQ